MDAAFPRLLPALLLATYLGAIFSYVGTFIYTLDDPYIHLALARNLLAGTYGINPGELAAPSSSILWPFLLAPFAWLPIEIYAAVPMAIDAAAILFSIHLLYLFFARLTTAPVALALALTAALCLNFFGLVMNGMEHSLQVLLALTIAYHLATGQRRHWRLFAALAVLPLVRYEGLAISVPVLAYLFVEGERRNAVLAFATVVLAVGAFSAFLSLNGLGILPSSVMVKLSDRPTLLPVSSFGNHAIQAGKNLIASLPLLLPLLYLLFSKTFSADRRPIIYLVAVPLSLHLLVGKSGSFGRYEVSMIAYGWLMSAHFISRKVDFKRLVEPLRLAAVVAVACLLSYRLIWPTLMSYQGAANIRDQQLQMSRLVRDYLKAPVAINDLGMVALFGGQRVLDLWGLGSPEAARHRRSTPDRTDWISELTTRQGVRHALVYRDWFKALPSSWILVGQFDLPGRRVTAGGARVSLFAVDAAAAQQMLEALLRFRSESDAARNIVKLTWPESVAETVYR